MLEIVELLTNLIKKCVTDFEGSVDCDSWKTEQPSGKETGKVKHICDWKVIVCGCSRGRMSERTGREPEAHKKEAMGDLSLKHHS